MVDSKPSSADDSNKESSTSLINEESNTIERISKKKTRITQSKSTSQKSISCVLDTTKRDIRKINVQLSGKAKKIKSIKNPKLCLVNLICPLTQVVERR